MKDALAAGMDRTLSPVAMIAVDHINAGPQVTNDTVLYWNAFMDLQSERPFAMEGLSAIPFSTIVDYCRFYGFDQSMSERVVKVVRALDAELIGEVKRRQDKDSK